MQVKDISLKEAESLAERNIGNPNFVILDVRTSGETHKCKFKNSVNIDIFSRNFIDELNKLDKDKIILVHCRTGNRSLEALRIMNQLGFKKVYHSAGGINCP